MSRTPFIYLAHPIDFVGAGANRRANQALPVLAVCGLAAYVPGQAFEIPPGSRPTSLVSSVNQHALTQCEGLVAFLPPEGYASIGVPMEIGQAIAEGKPVCVVAEDRVLTQSWALTQGSELVFTTEQFDVSAARKLQGMILVQRRHRTRPPVSKAMFVKADPGGRLPTRAYEGDAGFDLYTLGDWEIPPGENLDVPCGVSVQLPDTAWAMITGRSSTVRKHQLLVTVGIIDSGYRGPLYANVQNLSLDTVTEIKDGQRVAQLIPFPLTARWLHPIEVDALADSPRGSSGFGSSGS